jgi:hypothetical protein
VDTGSKLAEMDLKKKDAPVEKVDMRKKEPQIAPKKEETVEKVELQKKPVEPEVKVVLKKEEGFTTVVAATSSKEETPAAKATLCPHANLSPATVIHFLSCPVSSSKPSFSRVVMLAWRMVCVALPA